MNPVSSPGEKTCRSFVSTTLPSAIADNLVKDPGLRREDIFINLIEVKKVNWSFGNGIAQYAT